MNTDGQNNNKKGIKFELDESEKKGARIKVIGVGGGGSNAVNRMIEAGVQGVEFIAVNTDVQALENSKAAVKIQLGSQTSRGLGAGSNPLVGREAALEDHEKIIEILEETDMVFVTAGLGGGTGTGAAPVIAALATELGILTVAVVTKPFSVEGKLRMDQAERGLAELRGCVDTIITIPNTKLKETKEKITIKEAFHRADDVLLHAVQGISDLITIPGFINLDFADVKSVMLDGGVALMGIGLSNSDNAASKAMKDAIESKLLEENSIKGASRVLVNITGSEDMPLDEFEEAMELIKEEADVNAQIIVGLVYNNDLGDQVTVTVIATAFDEGAEGRLPNSFHEPNLANAVGAPLPIPQPGDKKKEDDDDTPAFIRRQAD